MWSKKENANIYFKTFLRTFNNTPQRDSASDNRIINNIYVEVFTAVKITFKNNSMCSYPFFLPPSITCVSNEIVFRNKSRKIKQCSSTCIKLHASSFFTYLFLYASFQILFIKGCYLRKIIRCSVGQGTTSVNKNSPMGNVGE